MDTVCHGVVIDIKVLFRGNVKPTGRRWHIRVSSALDDTVAEMEADVVDIPDSAAPPSSGVLTCAKCQKKYRQGIDLQKLMGNCGGPEPDKSVLPRGASMAVGILHRHDLGVYT